MLNAGDAAPDFTLLDADMTPVTLSTLQGNKNVVLYFYPKDDTPGCTIEAQDFTGMQDDFDALDTVVFGISPDDCVSHAAFAVKYGLSVTLLVDMERDAIEAYGVWVEKERDGIKRWGVNRSTFIIDKQGNIRHALYGVAPRGHAQHVLDLVKAGW
ncbi:MAG: peroxiredoxin [Gammaproteobacteria bacterium]|nr:peroxiredoxin [Gammaproteobacteria bacterium]MCP5135568.1 peroxiredoxin [Gammaproteobacteria bacterium]